MVSADLVREAENLLAATRDLSKSLRKFYNKSDVVSRAALKQVAQSIAEKWIVSFAKSRQLVAVCASDDVAAITVLFERLRQISQRSSPRQKYDVELAAIETALVEDIIVPLKQSLREETPGVPEQLARSDRFVPTIFVGHSFDENDAEVVRPILQTLEAIGLKVVTGEVPRAGKVSEKVMGLIEGQNLFLGIFTRREKLAGKGGWTTTQWVLDEKSFAYAKGKPLILLKEEGVQPIVGTHGDWEYLEFSRANLASVLPRIIRLFDVRVTGLHGVR